MAFFRQGSARYDQRCQQYRPKVVDAAEELSNFVKHETPDAVVLVLANTLTLSIATCSGRKLSDARMRISGEGMLMKQAVTVLSPRAKPRLKRLVLDLVKLITTVEKERWPVAGASRHWQNDVSAGRNVGPHRRRCGGLSVAGGLGVALPCASAVS